MPALAPSSQVGAALPGARSISECGRQGAAPALADKADSVANARRVLGQQVSNHLGSSNCSAGSLSQLVSGSSSSQPLVLSIVLCARRHARLCTPRGGSLSDTVATPIPFTADLLAPLARMAAGGSFDACTECGQFQTSAWGSTKGDACWCLSGFFADTQTATARAHLALWELSGRHLSDEQPYASYSAAKTQTAAQTQWSLTGDREDDSDGGGDVSRSSCYSLLIGVPWRGHHAADIQQECSSLCLRARSQAQCDKSSRSHSGASCLFTRPVTTGV